ncbi:pentapeptide repeat-containing protein [Thermomonospora echinospora]|uniref:pentapeptide repeat-containing protein n=1 Tax=Thermomonospora echinospora TaxID=1992 RepID=UPI001357F77C|nr:pentapeptide repeat-containing protein [Thermomonospora echinospora]
MPQIPEPTPEELRNIPADRRLELLELQRQRLDAERDRRRHSKHQWFNSIGILIGVLAAVAGLVATVLTWRAGQDELHIAKEGQVTDRYTKAVEQLGSDKREVRTAAVYALERIARDSARDRPTIIDVLAACTREHDPAPAIKDDALPPEPDTDVAAALTVLGRLPRPAPAPSSRRILIPSSIHTLDLHSIRVPHSQLSRANLNDADLTGANLSEANLREATLIDADLNDVDLTGADLNDADLTLVDLVDADLSGATLSDANLRRAILADADLRDVILSDASLTGAFLSRADLNGAILSLADLTGADLTGADLTDAYLLDANLTGADLTDTDLTGANLTGADLRKIKGKSADEVRRVARTDATTRF